MYLTETVQKPSFETTLTQVLQQPGDDGRWRLGNMLQGFCKLNAYMSLDCPVHSQGFNQMFCLRMIPSYILQAKQRQILIQVWGWHHHHS